MADAARVEKLAADLKVTAGYRFNAAARLDKKEKGSNVLVSVYSALLICLSVATFSLPLSSSLIRYASFGGIAASILLLVMSMRNFAHKFGVEAEQMHRSALDINELRRELLALPTAEAVKQLPQFSQAYNTILQKWSVNHTEEDFLKYKYKHKWEFDDIKDVADEKLPDRKFKELYEVSAGGVAFITILGGALLLFVGSVLWDSISEESESATASSQALQEAQKAAADATAAAARVRELQEGTGQSHDHRGARPN